MSICAAFLYLFVIFIDIKKEDTPVFWNILFFRLRLNRTLAQYSIKAYDFLFTITKKYRCIILSGIILYFLYRY